MTAGPCSFSSVHTTRENQRTSMAGAMEYVADLFGLRTKVAIAPVSSSTAADTTATAETTEGGLRPPLSSSHRVLVGKAGFEILTKDTGKRKLATADAVFEALARMVDSGTDARARSITDAYRANETAIVALRQEYADGEKTEGEAARSLLMLIGPSLEWAVASAVAANSGALRRARRASVTAPRPEATGASSTSATHPAEGGVGPLRRQRSGACKRESGAAVAHGAAPYGSARPPVLARRSSSRLAKKAGAGADGASAASSGLTDMMGSSSLLSWEEEVEEEPGGGAGRPMPPVAPRVRAQPAQTGHATARGQPPQEEEKQLSAARAAFASEDPVVRARALLERQARREEAVQIVQATWQQHSATHQRATRGQQLPPPPPPQQQPTELSAARAAFASEDPVVRARALLERQARREEAVQIVEASWQMRGESRAARSERRATARAMTGS